MNVRALLAIVIGVGAGCADPLQEKPPNVDLTLEGTVHFEKYLPGQELSIGLVALSHAPIQLVHTDTGQVLTENTTDTEGGYTLVLKHEGIQLADLTVRVLAHFEGKVIEATIYSDEEMTSNWSAEWHPELSEDFVITDRYVAGAFNIFSMVRLVEDRMNSLVPNDLPPPLAIRWLAETAMPCISCFYADQNILDLSGVAGDEDGLDDAVILHELGHYIEDTWAVYDNPGGSHNREHASPLLAWSEGFATWFQGALRSEANYIDHRPNGEYQLDLETPPNSALGVVGSLPEATLSEALVYSVLWDLTDAEDGEESVQYPVDDVLATVVGLTYLIDVGVAGVDFMDFLNEWRCVHTTDEDEAALGTLLEMAGFPLNMSEAPECPQETVSP